jgi:hypothetical protein
MIIMHQTACSVNRDVVPRLVWSNGAFRTQNHVVVIKKARLLRKLACSLCQLDVMKLYVPINTWLDVLKFGTKRNIKIHVPTALSSVKKPLVFIAYEPHSRFQHGTN